MRGIIKASAHGLQLPSLPGETSPVVGMLTEDSTIRLPAGQLAAEVSWLGSRYWTA